MDNKDKKKFRRDIGIYKPNPKGNGSVAQFKIGGNDDCMFLECANQNAPMKSPKPYDWENKIIVKLGESDLCKMLAYFGMHKPGAPLRLHHETPGGGNKQVELKWQEYNGRSQYYMTVSHQLEKGQPPKTRVSFSLGLDEVEYLKIGFKKALEKILAWD